MARARFIGDPKDEFSGPRTLTNWGHTFVKGEFVDVPDSVAKKAETNTHFEVEGSGNTPEITVAAEDISPDDLRDELDRRGVDYPKTAGKAALLKLFADSQPKE